MSQRRPLRLVLFLFDVLRLASLIGAMTLFRSATQGAGGTLAGHSIAFASPQALFPLLALFMVLDPVKYRDYVPLYVTGKLVSAIAIGSWLAASVQDTLMAMEIADGALLFLAAAGSATVLWDFASAALAFFFLKDRPIGDDAAYKPDLVVDTVDKDPGGT